MRKKLSSNNLNKSTEIKKLKKLESKDKWVFHGSPQKMEKIIPHQAYNYGTRGEKIPDGKSAVFASPFVDIAIFMAIINKENLPKGLESGYSFNSTNKEIKFSASKKTMDGLHQARGYVYVLDKTKFIRRSFAEFMSREEVAPEDIITVTEKDLPEDIIIKDS